MANPKLKVIIPNLPNFVARGTCPILKTDFQRFPCPYYLKHPLNGSKLPTQWELVAELDEYMIVEFMCNVNNEDKRTRLNYLVIGDEYEFELMPDPSPTVIPPFMSNLVTIAQTPGMINYVITDQSGTDHTYSISGYNPATDKLHRAGQCMITLQKYIDFGDNFGGMHVWISVQAGVPMIYLQTNWTNGAINSSGTARGHAYFGASRIDAPPSITWRQQYLQNGIALPGYHFGPFFHMIPQRFERSDRLILADNDFTGPDDWDAPTVSTDLIDELRKSPGWGIFDRWDKVPAWMPQALQIPNLDHVGNKETVIINQANNDRNRYFNGQTSQSGSIGGGFLFGDPIPNVLWPTGGNEYGGTSGGNGISQYDGCVHAQVNSFYVLVQLHIEQIRESCRQMGHIYENNGDVLNSDNYLNGNGSTPWQLSNSFFENEGTADNPWNWDSATHPPGTCPYEFPLVFVWNPLYSGWQAYDNQHLVRYTKSQKMLCWLDNDPLAQLYLQARAELIKMAFHPNTINGDLNIPTTNFANGSGYGRELSWSMDCIAAAYAVSVHPFDQPLRARWTEWIETAKHHFIRKQMKNGYLSAINSGKIAEDPPLGTGPPQNICNYWGHRTNEQATLVHGIVGIKNTYGDSTGELEVLIARVGEAIRDYGWHEDAPVPNGPIERYPAGINEGSTGTGRFDSRSGWPTDLFDAINAIVGPGGQPNFFDNFQTPTLMAHGRMEGATGADTGQSGVTLLGPDMINRYFDMTNTSTTGGLQAWSNNQLIDNISNLANTHRFIQDL